METPTERRRFLRGAALSAVSLPAMLAATRAVAATQPPADDDFEFEIVRSDEEWHEMLSDFEYGVLREGRTESQKTSPLWKEIRAGTYNCRGCNLHVYDGFWQVVIDKGWVFFRQSVPNSVLMGIDEKAPSDMVEEQGNPLAVIEAHCRRCGSHLGHILWAGGAVLHCTNGTSFVFTPAES